MKIFLKVVVVSVLLTYRISLFCISVAEAGSIKSIASVERAGQVITPRRQYVTDPDNPNKKIDVSGIDNQFNIFKKLQNGSAKEKDNLVKKITKFPENYNPAVLKKVAVYFAEKGLYQKSAFYFNISQIRARIDVASSKDKSLFGVPTILAQEFQIDFDPTILNKQNLMFNTSFIVACENSMDEALEWDKKMPRKYNRYWANPHSIRTMTYSLSENKNASPNLKAVSEKEYQEVFRQIHKAYEERNKKRDLQIKKTYEEIEKNSQKSNEIVAIITDEKSGDKKQAALKVEQNMGDYTPPALIAAGLYFAKIDEYKKAGRLTRFGVFRGIIDNDAASDKTVKPIVEILKSLSDRVKITDKQADSLFDEVDAITKNIVIMDKKVPRNYEKRWAILNGQGVKNNAYFQFPNEQDWKRLIELHRKEFLLTAKKEGLI